MANADNLKKGKATQFKSGEQAASAGKKGGIASGASKRKKADIRRAINDALNGTYKIKDSNERVTGTEALVQAMFKVAMDPKNKNNVAAFNALIRASAEDKTALDKKEQRAKIAVIALFLMSILYTYIVFKSGYYSSWMPVEGHVRTAQERYEAAFSMKQEDQ